jgi:hypothetical protein
MIPASDTWADQLRAFPWIADEGGGVLYNQAFYDARRRLPDGDGAVAQVGSDPFHAQPDSAEE